MSYVRHGIQDSRIALPFRRGHDGADVGRQRSPGVAQPLDVDRDLLKYERAGRGVCNDADLGGVRLVWAERS